jgi:transposase
VTAREEHAPGCSTWSPAAPAPHTPSGSRRATRPSAPGIKVATLDPFPGYKNALDDELEDAIAVLDAFHVVKLGTAAVDEVRRRVQQQVHGHRGRSGDPLYGIRNVLRCGEEKLTDKQKVRLEKAGGTEAINGLIELHRRVARGFRDRDNYRLRMLLIGGGLTHPLK